MARYRETVRYRVEEIQSKAREDARYKLPSPDDPGPFPYENELIHANAQQAGNVVEDCREQLEELDSFGSTCRY